MGKEVKYKIYVLLKRTDLEVKQLKEISKETNPNKILEEIFLSIQYLLKEKTQERCTEFYMKNLKLTVIDLINDKELNIRKALSDFKRITSSIYIKKIKCKKTYFEFIEDITNILLAKEVKSKEEDQYDFLYSILFDIQQPSYLEYILKTYPHYVNVRNKDGKHIFCFLLEHFIETKDIVYFNQVINIFLFHSRFHLEKKENKYCRDLLEQCLNKKDEKREYYIQILNLLLKKEITKENIEAISKKYEIKTGFSDQIKEEIFPKKDFIITIDGPNTLDMDDALSIEKKEDHYILKVYITDVARVIKASSYLDQEALRRTESLYLSDKVIPMLPTELSNDRLSLNKNNYKNVFVYEVKIYKDGSIGEFSIKKDSILVDRKTTYQEVNRILKEGIEDSFGKTCFNLSEVAYLLKQKNPNKTVYRIIEDFQNLEIYNRKNAYQKRTNAEIIVEEAMLLINHLCAKLFYEKGYPYIYRNHLELDGTIEKAKITELEEKIKKNYKNQQDYIEILKSLSHIYPKPFYSPNNQGHYGLHLSHYSHCTSPIRRYPDIIQQRLLDEYFFQIQTKKQDQYWEKEVGLICDYCNKRMQQNFCYEKEYENTKRLIKK